MRRVLTLLAPLCLLFALPRDAYAAGDSTATMKRVVFAANLLSGAVGALQPEDGTGVLPAGWQCIGLCGTGSADGVVVTPPSGTQYLWVSTAAGVPNVNLPGVGGSSTPTNGSRLLSPAINAKAGDVLTFTFNYVTSDGGGFADYGWARLLSGGAPVATLFTARTTPGGNSVPGFAMPSPSATLTPSTVSIVDGPPVWSPLGASSGTCFDVGCGYTGWVRSDYVLGGAGSYQLEVGVTNWNDEAFDSGMAFAGIAVNNVLLPINPAIAVVPEPQTWALLLCGLGALAVVRRRRV
jgi:hypothetical protein